MSRLRYVSLFLIGLATQGIAFDQKHTDWDKWLKQYVTVKGPVSTVAYATAKSSPQLIENYLKAVEGVSKSEYLGFSNDDKLAYLINAYNAFTVKLILDNYPVSSIKKTAGFLKSPWKKKFFKLFGEEEYLDGIEHERIRKEFSEPRIHFAVVCASVGCPQLRNEAFVGPRLNEQLEAGVKAFLKDSARNSYDAAKNQLSLSKIFDWYKGDFEKAKGSVQKFVAPYFATDVAGQKQIESAEIKYLDYDWNLNETK